MLTDSGLSPFGACWGYLLDSNSGLQDDEGCFDSIDDYLSREPPPAQEFLQLEKEYRTMIAKEKQLAVAQWRVTIDLMQMMRT